MKGSRASYSCARCSRRKKKCDRSYPSCSQCTNAKVQCVGLDRRSDKEVPRSLVTHLEDIIAAFESDPQLANLHGGTLVATHQPQQADSTSPYSTARPEDAIQTVYALATAAARGAAPAASSGHNPRRSLPYYRVFFQSAELPFPLAFQSQRLVHLPLAQDKSHSTQLPEEVTNKLMSVYVDSILPQYPLFRKEDILEIYRRFKASHASTQVEPGAVPTIANPDEHFFIYMILAITTLSSRARDYRKLASFAESLRRDAFACVDFGVRINRSTTTAIQQLLLLAQYGFLSPSTTNLWQVVSDAARTALELGLHQTIPAAAGLDDDCIEFRKRLYWTLFVMERSVSITSHRPASVSSDQIHVQFPVSQDDPNFPSQSGDEGSQNKSTQASYIKFIDRVRFMRIQTEICAVNIGLRVIPRPSLSYEDWVSDIERRIVETKTVAATAKSCAFMVWHALLLLHMPCARNPTPNDTSVLEFFDAAVKLSHGYWEMIEANNLDYPWHATHHCYEAGNLILYALWHHQALIRRHYSTTKVFEIVHQISSIFILLEKQWPEAQRCGTLFDRMRKGALSYFQEHGGEVAVEANLLRELVFRENADVLYAHEQPPPPPVDQFSLEPLDLEFNIDYRYLESSPDYLGFFSFFESGDINPDFGSLESMDANMEATQAHPLDLYSRDDTTTSPAAAQVPRKVIIDRAHLKEIVQKLPICSHCKKRRIKCDTELPACRNCTKQHRDCGYYDTALAQETSRKHIDALAQHVERLLLVVNQPSQMISEEVGETSQVPNAADIFQSLSMGVPEVQTPLHQQIPSNILYPASGDGCRNSDVLFFGATSAFARLAALLARCSSVSLESSTAKLKRPTLFDAIFNSLRLQGAMSIGQTEAQSLAWYYYRSVEITLPILGQELIAQTLDHAYSLETNPCGNDESSCLLHIRFKFVVAIALALVGDQDRRFYAFADILFQDAVSCASATDLIIQPSIQSLQFLLLMAVYSWIRPGSMDIWRLLGHASRMCLDIIEAHGSTKTDSTYAGVLYRTLYTVETKISVAFGRPHHLPEGKDIPASSPDVAAGTVGELSSLVYNLARIQNRLHRDMIGTEAGLIPGKADHATGASDSSLLSAATDLRAWLDDWNAHLDNLYSAASSPEASDQLRSSLQRYGLFQQCEALLLAKAAADRRGVAIISSEEELAVCMQIIQITKAHSKAQGGPVDLMIPGSMESAFPIVWTRAHTLFTALTIIIQHMPSCTGAQGADLQRLVQIGLDTLKYIEYSNDQQTESLVECIKHMLKSIDSSWAGLVLDGIR